MTPGGVNHQWFMKQGIIQQVTPAKENPPKTWRDKEYKSCEERRQACIDAGDEAPQRDSFCITCDDQGNEYQPVWIPDTGPVKVAKWNGKRQAVYP